MKELKRLMINDLIMTEKQEHKAVCQYLKSQYPKVIFNTDMSGLKLTIGQSVQAKALRSSRGFPDIVIYEPRGGYHGLFIEMKRTGEKLYKKNGDPKTDHIREQIEMVHKLKDLGYYAFIAYGFNDAKDVIDTYMRLEKIK